MNGETVIELVGSLPASRLEAIRDLGRRIGGHELRPGLYRGRNGGGPPPAKWVARNVVQREWFAKMILDGHGINVRCLQDGTHRLRPAASPGGAVVDLPFALTLEGLDYGWHVAGRDVPGTLQFRDLLWAVPFAAFAEALRDEELARVGGRRGAPAGDGTLVIGFMAPLGIEAIAGMPFGMVWSREATPEERASVDAYLSAFRWFDSGWAGRGPRR
jgi:hypothetical protein